jgi:hypothetical protein
LLRRCDAYSYISKFIAVEITSTIRHIAAEVALGEEEGCPGFASPITVSNLAAKMG